MSSEHRVDPPGTDDFDVVVVGAGSGGVSVAQGLAEAGQRVAVVADGYVGGECPFVACMPSKSLLRSARARREIRDAPEHGAASVALRLDDAVAAWGSAVQRRDATANQRDDSSEVDALADAGVTVLRGFGRLDGPGRVRLDNRVLTAPRIVLDTGSVPVIPDLDGLDSVPTWTSDQALSSPDYPPRLVVLGAGPIGCELAQAYAAFGVQVTVVDPSPRPVPNEDPAIGELMARVLTRSGVQLELGSEPAQVGPGPDTGVELRLEDGREVAGDRLLMVVGRRPATDDLGLDTVDVVPGEHGEIVVDARCQAADGLWAVGDVTGVAPYTHTANHQARVVVDEILHRPGHDVTSDAIPRAVYTEPPLAAVGLTEAQARDRYTSLLVAEVDLAQVSRAGAEGDGPLGPPDASGGLLRLIADADTRTLVGASAIGPDADSWITEATLAIRAKISLDVLADVVRPFPTFAEAYTSGYRDLVSQLAAR